jgi:hypothetical protein
MKRISLALLLVVSLLLGLSAVPALADTFMLHASGQPAEPPNLDSSQPDTIRYDIGGSYYLYGPQNLWGIVRFTAPSVFELRCIYIQMLNNNSVNNGIEVYVYDDIGGLPGNLISGPYRINGPIFIGYTWLDVEIDLPYPSIGEGENFFVVFGPAPTGPQGQGWYLYFDNNGNTENRSGYGTSLQGPWNWTYLIGDLMVRAGGEMAGFTDLTTLNCYNATQQFFFDESDQVVYKAEVKNIGTEPVTSYRIIWRVFDPSLIQVWADSADYGALNPNAVALQTCPSAWTAEGSGYYLATATVWNEGDGLPDNNTAPLEQGIGLGDGGWFKYDDGSSGASVSGSPGQGWGNRFNPPHYPVKIDSVQVWISGATPTSDVRIVNFVGTSVNSLYNYTGALISGANTIDVSAQNLVVFEGGIGVGYMYLDPGSIYMDNTPPLAAVNSRMVTVAYQIQGTAWAPLATGDWMLRAYVSHTEILPPWPVIRVEPDSVDFGEVTIDTPDTAYFWVFSDGAQDLIVTDINPAPAPIVDEVFVTDTAFTLASLDSHEVMVIWIPNEVGAMSPLAKCAIFNNDTSPYPYNLPLKGTAVGVGVLPIEGSVPVSYSLQGNFPNPFNASTRYVLSLPAAGPVSFKIYDIRGREVASLAQGNLQAGSYELTFDASHLTSGVYIARVVAGSFQASQKLVLLK